MGIISRFTEITTAAGGIKKPDAIARASVSTWIRFPPSEI